MTMLSIIQDVCRRTGLSVPTSVADNTSQIIVQLLALANEEGEELSSYNFKQLERRATFTSVATENQGALEDIAPDFDRLIGETFWDGSSYMYVGGPTGAQEWEVRKVRNVTGPTYRFRLMLDPTTLKNSVMASPVPTAGHTMSFEYYSNYWCKTSAGEGKSDLTADDDVVLLPEKLFKLGVRWRWKKEKGLAYEEDFNSWEAMRDTLVSQADGTGAVSMSQSPDPVLIGAWNLPDGNYNQ